MPDARDYSRYFQFCSVAMEFYICSLDGTDTVATEFYICSLDGTDTVAKE
jgi:hypothetical protein